jgi:hypothetical protein
MNGKRLLAPITLAVLAGCVASPPAEVPDEPASGGEREVELNLNLPDPESCDCPPASADYTFLERGFRALAAGDAIEAVQYFQRYRRLEKNPTAAWEADLAIAYASMLPDSPFYDVEAAAAAHQALRERLSEEMRPHETAVLLDRALAALAEQFRRNEALAETNGTLRRDLEKREDALRRLRELTLGQPGGRR